MAKPRGGTVSAKLKAALQVLRALHVPFRGPFVTPKDHRIYLVDECLLTELEIISLHEQGKFAQENVATLLHDLKSLQLSQAREIAPLTPAGQSASASRRSQRVMLRLDVLVRFEMPEGGRLQSHAFTVAVNAHGGRLESPFRMTVGQRITLVNPQTAKEIAGRILQVQQGSDGYFTTAFEFESPSPWFWDLAIAPPDWGAANEPA